MPTKITTKRCNSILCQRFRPNGRKNFSLISLGVMAGAGEIQESVMELRDKGQQGGKRLRILGQVKQMFKTL